MASTISMKELSASIASIQIKIKNDSTIEKDLVIKLRDIVQSSREVPNQATVLRNVMKSVIQIFDSGKDISNQQDEQLSLLIGDCIDCLYDILKKNETGIHDLYNQAVEAILVISQKNSQTPNILLKCASSTLLNIINYNKIELKTKKEFLKALNFILENSDRKLRYKLRNDSKLDKLSKFLYTCGDYDVQINILETFFRYISIEERKLYARKWLTDNSEIISAFLAITDFEPDCRKFLNVFNASLANDRLVYSIPCNKALFGNCEVKKPEHPGYEEFWVDFNLGSNSVSLVCSQESFYLNSVLANQILPGLWETVAVEAHIIKKVTLQKIYLPMDSQGHIKEPWEMHLILFQPCYAVFSSFPCNFEGNACILIFENSFIPILHMVLQKLFPDKYHYGLDVVKRIAIKKNKKSSVSFDNTSNTGSLERIQNLNDIGENLRENPMRANNLEEKEKMSEISMEGSGIIPYYSKMMERNSTERILPKNVFSKTKLKASQSVGRLPTLTPRLKATPKSPFKPLEIVISPRDGNKRLNTTEKTPITTIQNSNKASFLENHRNIPKASRENVSSTSTSSFNNNNKVCVSKSPPTIPQGNSIKNNDAISVNEDKFSKENSHNQKEEEHDQTLPKKSDNENENSRKKHPKKSEATNSPETKVSSQNNQTTEIPQGRVLRSHMIASQRRDKFSTENRSISIKNSSPFDYDLSESDSETNWLKKNQKKLPCKRRAQSLGALHLKQLCNREIVLEKAAKRKKEETYHEKEESLKGTQSISNKNDSKGLSCKKKLFNYKAQSFLGPLSNDNNNGKITTEVLNKQSNARNKSPVKDARSASSFFSDNWFSETDSELSWLKPGYKDKRLNFKAYTNQRNKDGMQEKGKKSYKLGKKGGKGKAINDIQEEDDENDARKKDGKSRTMPNIKLNLSSTEHNINAATKRPLEENSKSNEVPRNEKKIKLEARKENISDKNNCSTSEIEEDEEKTSLKENDSDLDNNCNSQISPEETSKDKMTNQDEQENLRELSPEKFIQDKTDGNIETKEGKTLSKCDRSKGMNDKEIVVNIQSKSQHKNLEQSSQKSAKHNLMITQTENVDDIYINQSKQSFSNNRNLVSSRISSGKVNAKLPFSKRLLDSFNRQGIKNLEEESTENLWQFSQPEYTNEESLINRNEGRAKNNRTNHHTFVRKCASKEHDAPLSKQNSASPSPNENQNTNRDYVENTEAAQSDTSTSENNSPTHKSNINESLDEDDNLIPPSIPVCNDNNSSHCKSSIFHSKNVTITRGTSNKSKVPDKGYKNTDIKKMPLKKDTLHLTSHSEVNSSDSNENIDLTACSNQTEELNTKNNNNNSIWTKSTNIYDVPQQNLLIQNSKFKHNSFTGIYKRSSDIKVSKEKNQTKQHIPTSEEVLLEKMIADTSLVLNRELHTLREKAPSFDASSSKPRTGIQIRKNRSKPGKRELENENNSNPTESNMNNQFKRKKSTKLMDIRNGFGWNTSSYDVSEHQGSKRKKPIISQDDLLNIEHIQEKENSPSYPLLQTSKVQHLLKAYISTQYKSLQELGSCILLYKEEAMNELEEDNQNAWKEMTGKYINKINNEIETAEENMKKLEIVQARFKKCFKYINNTYFMKSVNDLEVIESLSKIKTISKDMRKENEKDKGLNASDEFKAIILPKIKVLQSNYMQKEKKKEMVKTMTRFQSLFSF